MPQSNGLAERSVRNIKSMLTKAGDPYLALLSYRTTPLHNGFSPAELLMGRRLIAVVSTKPEHLEPKGPNLRKVKFPMSYNVNTDEGVIRRNRRKLVLVPTSDFPEKTVSRLV